MSSTSRISIAATAFWRKAKARPFWSASILSLGLLLAGFGFDASAAEKKLVLVAGRPSHGPGDHEFNAGSMLLKKCLDKVSGLQVALHKGGWPDDPKAFEDADAIFLYMDGGGEHPGIKPERLKFLGELMKKGIGLGCAHYAVEVPKGEPGDAWIDWIGGHYEHLYSVNPMWSPEFKKFPDHVISRGVKPFSVVDEWYFNMRFRPEMKGVVPILVAKPSDQVRNGPYVSPRGPYLHIVEAKGREEIMMWAIERADGGRGFGFTGGHKHVNWANDNFRKVVLNALLWIAKVEVPSDGVPSSLTPEEVTLNLDPKRQPDNAVNITGAWNFSVETDAGSGTPSFSFIHAGQNVLGTYKGLFGEAELNGSVRDQELTFTFTVSVQDQPATVTYTGKIESGTSMKGTVRFGDLGEGTWTAKKAQ